MFSLAQRRALSSFALLLGSRVKRTGTTSAAKAVRLLTAPHSRSSLLAATFVCVPIGFRGQSVEGFERVSWRARLIVLISKHSPLQRRNPTMELAMSKFVPYIISDTMDPVEFDTTGWEDKGLRGWWEHPTYGLVILGAPPLGILIFDHDLIRRTWTAQRDPRDYGTTLVNARNQMLRFRTKEEAMLALKKAHESPGFEVVYPLWGGGKTWHWFPTRREAEEMAASLDFESEIIERR
jgi:hypothetical protein